MIIYPIIEEVRQLHERIIQQSGGSTGIRDLGGLESAVAQPQMKFAGQELYPAIAEKAAALGYSLVLNHAFIDGNKRIGHAVMEVFLVVNGYELDADVDDQEAIILRLAAGEMTREEFTEWVSTHLIERPNPS